MKKLKRIMALVALLLVDDAAIFIAALFGKDFVQAGSFTPVFAVITSINMTIISLLLVYYWPMYARGRRKETKLMVFALMPVIDKWGPILMLIGSLCYLFWDKTEHNTITIIIFAINMVIMISALFVYILPMLPNKKRH